MSINVDAYFKEVDQMPWGKLFYDLLWQQLNELTKETRQPLHILDFGAGFGKTADYLANLGHQVVAYEPNQEMQNYRYHSTNYTYLTNDFEANIAGKAFDVILLHNVLEYVENRSELLNQLWTLLKTGGTLSLVKHNSRGRVLVNAVLREDPKQALLEYQGQAGYSINFGTVNDYSNDWLLKWVTNNSATVTADYGIRTFYGLSQNSEIKFSKKWQEDMLALEKSCDNDPIFKEIAMFRHFMLQK